MSTSFLQVKDSATSTLNTTITSGGLTIVLAGGGGALFPTTGNQFVISIDSEDILIDSRSTDTLTVNASGRGYNSTTPAAHTAGATVSLFVIAKHVQDLDTAVNNLENGVQGGYYGLLNGKITTAVASNNLTVAIKTLSGADPSTTSPVYVRIGNSIRSITAALSLTKNAGTNWFGSGSAPTATIPRNYYVYLVWNTTANPNAVSLAFALNPFGTLYSDFNNTSTSALYFPFSGSDTPGATDEVQNIGRFEATLSATAAFNWSILATAKIIQFPIYDQLSFYVQATSTQSSITTVVDLTGLTLDIPIIGTQRVEATIYLSSVTSDTDDGTITLSLKEGATVVQTGLHRADVGAASSANQVLVIGSFIASAGVHTYKATLEASAGTLSAVMSATSPGYILVKFV